MVAPQTSGPAESPVSGRLGITASKKVGNAVVRNRVKRLVREYVRRHQWVPPGVDVVIIAKRSASELHHYDQVTADLARIGSRLASC